MRGERTVARDVIDGFVAGAVGTWVMGRATSFMYEHESAESRQRYEQVTGGKAPPERTAEKLEAAAGLNLSKTQHQALAQASHWLVGLGAGAVYALARRRMRHADRGQGLLFGLAFWVVFDELATVAMGVARPPQEYPWQAHARGLVGHAVYGVVAETTLDALEQVA